MRSGVAAVVVAVLLAAPPARAAERVLYVGDSLGVGTTPQLAQLLGSAAVVRGNSRIGRPSPEGLGVLRSLIRPSDRIVVFDLGTNDDPAQPARLASDLSSAREAAAGRCLIVATLNRPPLNGVPVTGLNRAVHAFADGAPDVELVDWHAAARAQPSLLGPDRVHPTPQGYALRAQLFAQAVAACATGAPATAPRGAARRRAARPGPRPRPAHRPVKVPGIEASGITFSEPLTFRAAGVRVSGELALPNSKPPYTAVALTTDERGLADDLTAAGLAVLVYEPVGSRIVSLAGQARGAARVVASQRDIRAVVLLGIGRGAHAAALAAAANPGVRAVVALGAGLAPATNRAWAIRHALGATGTAPVATWFQLEPKSDDEDADPRSAWRAVRQPVLAIWGTADRSVPIRAAAQMLADALPPGRVTYAWFRGRPHVVATPAAAALIVRWIRANAAGAHPGPALPPANGGPAAVDVTRASALASIPVQIAWLFLPALIFAVALARASAPSALVAAAAAAALASFAAIAAGIAIAIHDDGRGVAHVAGIPAPFAVAYVLTAATVAATAALARRRAWVPAAGAGLCVALALFWLL